MKKLLALVLALVMTLGLATVGASAAYDPGYKDKSDIDYTEATNVMTIVGVFEGKGENFAPKDNLNRAEAAKLIAYLMLGNKTAEAMKGTGTRFTDVPASHWAVGYIEYLATSGIVSGVGDGKFDPNGQVTTVAFAKMLDVALGYDAQIEGFVGEGWNINIMKKANDNDLFEQLDLNSNDVITREQAAQMCLNALKAKTYEYDSKGTTVSLGDAKVVVDAKTAKAKTNSDSKKVRAIKEKTDSNGNYYLELGEDLYNGDLKLEKGTSKDDYGRPADKWTYKSENVGTYTNKSDLVETFTKKVTQGMLYDTVGKSVYDSIKDGKSELYYYEDGAQGVHLGLASAASDDRTNTLKQYIQKDGDKKINNDKSTGNGTVTEVFLKNAETNSVYSNSHDVVTIVVSNTYLLKAASEYRSSTEDIVFDVKSLRPGDNSNGVFDGTRLKLEDHPEIKDMAKDDYILATAHIDGSKYKIDSVKKAEVLTGKVDQVVVTDSVTIDGEKLSFSKKIDDTSKAETYSIGQQAKVVLDQYGYVIYVDEAVSASNYVFISEFFSSGNSTTAKPKANAYFTDGTTSEITVKEVYDGTGTKYTEIGALDDATDPTGYAAGKVVSQKFVGWYSYSKNASGEYTLNRLGSNYKKAAQFLEGTGSLIYSDRVNFENANDVSSVFSDTTSFGTLKANDKTIMIVTQYGKNDVDVYTGVKNLPDVNLEAGKGLVFAVMDGSYAKYVFVSVTGGKVLGSNDQNLLYVIKYDKQNKGSDNETYYTFKAVDVDGNEVTIQADSSTTFQYSDFHDNANDKIYGAYYSTSRNANGRYTSAVRSTEGKVENKYGNYVGLTNTSNAITGSSGTISFGSVAYTLDKDCKLIVISKVDALNRLQGADHEITVYTSGESVESMLKSYNYTYDVQFKLTDSTNGKLSEAYITIRSATAAS